MKREAINHAENRHHDQIHRPLGRSRTTWQTLLPNRLWQQAIPVALCAAVALPSISPRSRAELPPQAYQSYQENSAEALTIKVKSVKIAKTEADRVTSSKVTAQAEVTGVTRSASGLHPGDTIRITYTLSTREEPIVGPSQPDLLREGSTYPAFVKKADAGTYAPAAGGKF